MPKIADCLYWLGIASGLFLSQLSEWLGFGVATIWGTCLFALGFATYYFYKALGEEWYEEYDEDEDASRSV